MMKQEYNTSSRLTIARFRVPLNVTLGTGTGLKDLSSKLAC